MNESVKQSGKEIGIYRWVSIDSSILTISKDQNSRYICSWGNVIAHGLFYSQSINYDYSLFINPAASRNDSKRGLSCQNSPY